MLDLIEETNDNKLNEYDNINHPGSDYFISSNSLNIFEVIDKSFSNLLSTISYSINSELFKIKLIKKLISNDILKILSIDSNKIYHPHPFVFKYELNSNNISNRKNNYSEIYLFTLNNVELEYYNIELSMSRNKINLLKNKVRLLNKKEEYWKKKEITLNNLN